MPDFAALMTRVNASVITRLSDSTATIVLPADAAGEEVVGLFDAAYQVVDIGTGIATSAPAFTCDQADLPQAVLDALEAGDPVSVELDGCTYAVVEEAPDGAGMTMLRLRKP